MLRGRTTGRSLDYVTSSNNRDGLAIRAAGDSLLQRQEEGENPDRVKRRKAEPISL